MTTPTYIVRGLGNPNSIYSSSHGAGRQMSRKHAKEKFTNSQMRKDLEQSGVTLIGGSLDECSMAYKNIDDVMKCQSDLVKTVGSFTPWIVRMSEEQKKPWEKE
jgi:tRNA-splicing ligase RtcB